MRVRVGLLLCIGWLSPLKERRQPSNTINTPHNPSTDILHSPAYEDRTDSEF